MPKKDKWPELCRYVEQDDLLPVRECGPWTENKLYFWSKYVDITTTAMVGNSKWKGGLVYVDLFAGPGVCKVRGIGRRLPGSPLIAAHAPKPFTRIIAVEIEPENVRALRTRLRSTAAADSARVLSGDCNAIIDQVAAEIPSGALTLAFVDLPGFDAHFETLRRLALARRVDFLILFADSIDLVRNLGKYASEQGSKVDQMFGPGCDWRAALGRLQDQTPAKVRELFEGLYQKQIRTQLGYKGLRTEPITGPHGPLYRLIYASKDERGLDFWDKTVSKDRGGQGSLPFGS